MKIMIVSRGYPTNKYIMNGIFEFDQAKALTAIGHTVVYLAIDLRSIRRWRRWGRESLVKDSVSIESFNFPLGRVPKKILQIFRNFGLSLVFKGCIKKFGQPDIIHAHFTEYGLSAVKTLKRTNIPIVMTEHSSGITERIINPYLKKIASYTYSRCDKVFVVSPSLKQSLRDIFNIESIYIPNIVDVKAFKLGHYNSNPDRRFTIVSIGGLIPRKNMGMLIREFAVFNKQNQKSELIIFGEGPEQKSLKLLIEDLGLTDYVKLMGMHTRDEIAPVLLTCDLFILVSKNETFGVVYIEALACGVPVIATKCGGPEGFVHDGNGILIPVDDEKALLEAMNTMYGKASTYDRAKIAAEIRKKFSPESVAVQLEEIYRELI